MEPGRNDGKPVGSRPTQASANSSRTRIYTLWGALVVYFLIMLNALRYASVVPYQAFIAGAIVNMAIIVSLVMALQRAYKNRGR